MTKSKLGLYIHIPFCQKKCHYCDFFSLPSNAEIIDKYSQEIANEIYLLSKSNPNYYISTIYLGGGTPSLLSLKNLEEITKSIYTNFECNVEEFTIEVNPNSSQNLEHYKEFGIDRISLGIQSFDDNILKKIGRLHDKKTAIKALDKAANHYDNVSGDLIIGIDENQGIVSDAKILRKFVKHISSYMLKVEDGTMLQKQICNNLVAVATEETQVSQYEKLYTFCMENDFLRYETSNFARALYEGKHNLGYWDMSPYLGVGASAHSYIDNKRYYNKSDINSYILGKHSGTGCQIIEREYSYNATIEEYIMLALRTEKGIKISDFNKKFGKDFLQDYKEKIKKTAQYTQISQDYFRIKPQFMLVQNSIILELL